ncbi:hypothetical protein FHS29_006959 [Saccharothrix tamanrassetensis]|uniref:Uncharacterized protein n=1 Tax=Saccharothrix tamanrassetensis TaxID=1051531 RepID=A0A841CYC9_9PSEU|nr:hypothetical protein [Saccharothrix tamanrassetensis]MBB5960336.1 hypothetical protein [Saccharothrix tamanrassetensis]
MPDHARLLRKLDLPRVLAVVDAHAEPGSPYAATGALLRAVGSDLADLSSAALEEPSRVAHFLAGLLRVEAPCAVVVENAQHADVADAEVLAVLLHRDDVRLVVCTGMEPVFDPPGGLPAVSFRGALASRTVLVEGI